MSEHYTRVQIQIEWELRSALARPMGEELRSGFMHAIVLKSVIHRHNLDPNLRR